MATTITVVIAAAIILSTIPSLYSTFVYRGGSLDQCGSKSVLCLSDEVCVSLNCTKIMILADDIQRLEKNTEEVAAIFSVWKITILKGYMWVKHRRFVHPVAHLQIRWESRYSGRLFRIFSSDGTQTLVSLEGRDRSFSTVTTTTGLVTTTATTTSTPPTSIFFFNS